jgi:hypothetical protein
MRTDDQETLARVVAAAHNTADPLPQPCHEETPLAEEKKETWFNVHWWASTLTILTIIGGGVAWVFDLPGKLGLFGSKPPVATQPEIVKSTEKPVAPRAFLSLRETMRAIAKDLETADTEVRPRLRYVTLTHLHNNRERTDAELELGRQALVTLAGYMSPPGQTAVFRPVTADRTLYAVDLKELGWDDAAWRKILKEYPYSLKFDRAKDDELQSAAKKVRELSGGDVLCVRGDWLVQAVIRPPLGGVAGTLKLPARDVPAPLQNLAHSYASQTLDLAGAAADLGLPDVTQLETLLRKDTELRERFGQLAPLLEGGRITRPAWEARPGGASPFQEISRSLGLGVPVLEL